MFHCKNFRGHLEEWDREIPPSPLLIPLVSSLVSSGLSSGVNRFYTTGLTIRREAFGGLWWCIYGVSVVYLWSVYGVSMECLWVSLGVSMGCLWVYLWGVCGCIYGVSVVYLWSVCGCLWVCMYVCMSYFDTSVSFLLLVSSIGVFSSFSFLYRCLLVSPS